MKLNIKTILRYALYAAILFFFCFSFYYSYWYDDTVPEGFIIDLYYGVACLALLFLIRPTRGLSWLLLPVMYLIPYFLFGWGSLNKTVLIQVTIAAVVLALVHMFWIYKPNRSTAQ